MIYFTGAALGWVDGWDWFADLIAKAYFFVFYFVYFLFVAPGKRTRVPTI